MINNRLEVELLLNDRLTNRIGVAEKRIQTFSSKTKKSFIEMAAKIWLVQQAFMAVIRATSGFVGAANKVEQLGVRLKVLLGSVEEGNALFAEMSKLAGQVPKTYDEIMESATMLAAVVKDGTNEVTKLMPLIVDLSAATGISVRDVSSQMIRMYSSGASAADMFRDRGVLAMLGFKAGVSYTAEETMKQVVASWEDAGSKFKGASKELAETWEGTMSMLNDAWFKFNANLGEFLTKSPTILKGIEAITFALGFWAEHLDPINESLSNQDALMGDLYANLEKVNLELEHQMQLQERAIFGDQEAYEQNIIDLLTQKARILNTINAHKEMAITITKKLGALEDAHVKSYIKHQEKKAKTDEDLKKQGLNSSINILEILGEKNKAAAIAGRVLSFGKAMINAHEAYTEALADSGNPAWAGFVFALGAAEAALIAAQPLAAGGIVKARPGGMLAQIGEGGHDEAVIPLDRAGNIFGDTNINIIIEGGINSDGRSIEDVAEELGFLTETGLREARGF